jgi:hypothetical protein
MAKFPMGQLVTTPGALDAFKEADQTMYHFVARHLNGDWGEISEADKAENELSVQQGFCILSAYTLKTGVKFWIITEADRSATTVLLPSEY